MYLKHLGMVFFTFLLPFVISGVPQQATGEGKQQLDNRPDEIMTVKLAIGNVRRGPTLKSPVIGKIRKGYRVKAIDKKDKWYMIRLKGDQVGWAHESLFFNTHKTQVAGTGISKQIKEIRFKIVPEGREMVVFQLNGYFPPKTFSLDDGRPRVVCDFFETRLGVGIGRLIDTNGQIIQKIRIGIYKDPEPRVRVVFDLVSQENSDYEIQPMFFKDENIYALTIKRIPNK